MKPLSEQLSDLAARARQAEDVVAAAKAKNRAELESQRDRLAAAVSAATGDVRTGMAAVRGEVGSWWDDMRSGINGRLDAMRAEREQHKTERDLNKAENRADDAELDAADAIDFAAYAVDQAEYAVVDAVLARADADDLALQRG